MEAPSSGICSTSHHTNQFDISELIKIIVKKYDKSRLEKNAFYFLGAWNFKKEIFIKEKNLLKNGAKFILHLPMPHIYKK